MKTLIYLIGIIASMTFTIAETPSDSPVAAAPPVAKKVHTENHINGGTLADDYHWMREKSNPEVAQYLEAENAYADSVMKPTEGLQKKLYDEMVSHIKQTDVSVPYRKGGYLYYARWEAGKQYQIRARKKESAGAPEQITVDINELAKDQKFMALAAYEVSDDGNLLAYSTDNTGFRQYRMHVRDLRTGHDLSDTAEKSGSIAWANDNQTLFYTVEDPAKRQYRLYRHKLGTDSNNDDLVYEEKDERFEVSVWKSRSGKFLFMSLESHTTSEIRYLDAATPTGDWKTIAPRQQDIDYNVETHSSTLLKQDEVPGGYEPSRYKTERIWAVARDGVKVPISVVYRKDLKKPDGSNPLYVYAYGSYGINLSPNFRATRLSLLDRGVVMAYAQIRGGGDLGKPWHDAGRMMNKMNTFTDFIDCTE